MTGTAGIGDPDGQIFLCQVHSADILEIIISVNPAVQPQIGQLCQQVIGCTHRVLHTVYHNVLCPKYGFHSSAVLFHGNIFQRFFQHFHGSGHNLSRNILQPVFLGQRKSVQAYFFIIL